MDLKEKKLFLLDMDGTIYIDNMLFPDVREFLQFIKENGGRYIFLTNNSSSSTESFIERLKEIGIESDENDFVTSADATAMHLQKKTYKKIYSFGTKSFTNHLRSFRLPVTTELCDDIDCLCMGFDTELTFKKLEDACILLSRDIDYVAANPDLVYPKSYGYAPDCGSVAQMLYNASKRMPYFVGKPRPEMVYYAMEKSGFGKDETVIIGDRLYTDIACGINAGITSIFVLSGEGTKKDIAEYNITPDYIYENISELYKDLKRR